MGRASNLKRIRKYSENEINEFLVKTESPELDNQELFKICGDGLKLVESHFRIGRKDNKMYNRYKKKIDEILYKRVFRLDLVKPKDRELSLKTLLKKDLNFLYVLLMTECERAGFLFSTLRKNIPPAWIKIDHVDGKVKALPELNEQSLQVKDNKEKIGKHISLICKYIKENELEKDIRSKERYEEYIKLIDIKLSEMKSIENETFEQSFYRYRFEELEYLYKDILVIEEYLSTYLDPIMKIGEIYKEEGN